MLGCTCPSAGSNLGHGWAAQSWKAPLWSDLPRAWDGFCQGVIALILSVLTAQLSSSFLSELPFPKMQRLPRLSSTSLCPKVAPTITHLHGAASVKCQSGLLCLTLLDAPVQAVTPIRKAECSQKVPLGQQVGCKSLLICYICFQRANRRFLCSGAGTELLLQEVQRVCGRCDQAPRSWVCRIFAYYRRNWKNLEFTSERPLTSWTTVSPLPFASVLITALQTQFKSPLQMQDRVTQAHNNQHLSS